MSTDMNATTSAVLALLERVPLEHADAERLRAELPFLLGIMRGEIELLRKDKARLDWIEAHRVSVGYDDWLDYARKWSVHDPSTDYIAGEVVFGDTLRATVDAAMTGADGAARTSE